MKKTVIPFTWIEIGPHKYDVAIDSDLQQKGDVVGLCGPDTQDILIDGQIGPDVAKDAVLHESIHAILSQLGWGKRFEALGDKDTEEEFVRPFTTRLLSLLRDNKHLVSWLLSQE